MQQLTNVRFQAAAEAMLAQTVAANGGPVSHDPNNPDHVAYMEELARLNGYAPDRYPALFASFRKGATAGVKGAVAAAGAFVDNEIVDYVAPLEDSGLGSAHGIITRNKPVAMTFIAINIVNVDGNTHSVIASGANTSYAQQTTEVWTIDANAQRLPLAGHNYATISWSIEYVDGTGDAASSTSEWSYQTSKDPTVTAPAIRQDRHTGNMNNIMVGLSRGGLPAADVDYWFWQNDYANSTLLVPFVGSMYFTKPIAPLSSANPLLFFYMARTEGGMSSLVADNTKPYMSGFTIDGSDPKQLNFSLQATSPTAGNAINFGTSPWVADTQTFFTAKVVVTLNDGSLGWSSVLSSLNPDTNPTDGVRYIKPIIYVWHCLAAGTRIAMADGSAQPVENLGVGARVKSAGGTARNVQATLAQPHWGTVYVVTTQKGLSLTCSGTHPVMTPNGAMPASFLKIGSVVLHEQADDGSQPSGNAGSRIAIGIIGIAPPQVR